MMKIDCHFPKRKKHKKEGKKNVVSFNPDFHMFCTFSFSPAQVLIDTICYAHFSCFAKLNTLGMTLSHLVAMAEMLNVFKKL